MSRAGYLVYLFQKLIPLFVFSSYMFPFCKRMGYTFDKCKTRIASRTICLCPLHKIIRLEIFPTFAPRSPLLSYCFAQQTEVAIMCVLRQIFHEAIDGVAVPLAELFSIGPFEVRQTWVKERIFKADEHCSSSSPHRTAGHRRHRNVCSWMPLLKPQVIIAAMGCCCSTVANSYPPARYA
jgi:hypothetical protein